MITEDQVRNIAEAFWLKLNKKNYKLEGVHYIDGGEGKYATASRWIARYEKKQPKDSVVDDGDYRIIVTVDPVNGEAKLSDPI